MVRGEPGPVAKGNRGVDQRPNGALDLRLVIIVPGEPSVRLHNPRTRKDIASDRFVAVVGIDIAEIEFSAESFQRLGTFFPDDLKVRIAGAALGKLLKRALVMPRVYGHDAGCGEEE